jgi:FkbM family methyltransferase
MEPIQSRRIFEWDSSGKNGRTISNGEQLMEYQFFNGWKFPAYETRLLAVDENGESTYTGLQHVDVSLGYVKTFGTMVDIGANVGLITVPMAKKFQQVHAFECVPETYECLRHNTEKNSNVKTYNVAVSDFIGEIDVAIPKTEGTIYSSGWASISKERQDAFPEKDMVKVQTITLDSLNFKNRCRTSRNDGYYGIFTNYQKIQTCNRV